MKMQRHERNRFYHLPVYCGFCGQLAVTFDDDAPTPNPCEHTLYIAHDEGFVFVSERAESQLKKNGFKVSKVDEDLVEVTPKDEGEISNPDAITDQLDFADGLKIAAYVAAPSGFGTYVGFAPLESM